MSEPMTDEQRIAELMAVHPALLQPEAIELRTEVKRLRAERERAQSALTDQARAVVDSTGDLEDGINFDNLAKNAEVAGVVEALTAARGEAERLRAEGTGNPTASSPIALAEQKASDWQTRAEKAEIDRFHLTRQAERLRAELAEARQEIANEQQIADERRTDLLEERDEALHDLNETRAELAKERERADAAERAHDQLAKAIGEVGAQATAAEAQVKELRLERNGLVDLVQRVALVKTWTNEDGKKFVFVDDLLDVLQPDLARDEAEPVADPVELAGEVVVRLDLAERGIWVQGWAVVTMGATRPDLTGPHVVIRNQHGQYFTAPYAVWADVHHNGRMTLAPVRVHRQTHVTYELVQPEEVTGR